MSRLVTLATAEDLAMRAMLAAGFAPETARPTVEALVLAERDGLASHGLARLGYYLAQARSGKVDAAAVPAVETDGAVVRIDAGHGLAFPAVEKGIEAAIPVARKLGLAAVAIARSHHFGVAGHPVERLAREDLVALAFANTPAAMAPWGGRRALFGTDPIAFAAPRAGAEPVVVDLSLSLVARGKIMIAAKAGAPIPEGWALDADGRPTTDAAAAMAGTMTPAGGAKGAALALMVELLAAGLTGARFGFEASSFFEAEGPPPGVGQLILALDPGRFGGHFADRAETMFAAIEAETGARLPGQRRRAKRLETGDMLALPDALVAELEALGRGVAGP
jgi:(2R)-3-sulfolactate dehydrogenase (NADP+)